jgi:hemerythrin
MSREPEANAAPVWQPSFPMAWDDHFTLGYGPIDHIHREFVHILARLQISVDDDQAPLMDELLTHVRAHFDEENRWMRETVFPPRECHIDEHAAVLASIVEVRELVGQGRHDVCHSLVQALADWFPGHAAHLDSALAQWMFKRKFDGKPLVLHRRVRSEPTSIPT